MKRWTVMLRPAGRDGSRTVVRLSAYQVWAVAALLAVLSFLASFFFARHHVYAQEVARLLELRQEQARQTAASGTAAPTAQERIELEQRVRAEYDATIAVITDKLGELREMESQVRNMTDLPASAPVPTKSVPASGGGKGGGVPSLADFVSEPPEGTVDEPSSVIQGLSDPSADLIVQEVNLRTDSLRGLVAQLRVRADRLETLPSIRPTTTGGHEISSAFGYRKDPFGLHITHHDGTDLRATYGTPVQATAKGVVVFAGNDGGGLGKVVKIDHGNGVETWYGHLKSYTVRVGEVVHRRDIIGRVGTTGRSTGPHLHYEVHVDGKPVDPAKYLKD